MVDMRIMVLIHRPIHWRLPSNGKNGYQIHRKGLILQSVLRERYHRYKLTLGRF